MIRQQRQLGRAPASATLIAFGLTLVAISGCASEQDDQGTSRAKSDVTQSLANSPAILPSDIAAPGFGEFEFTTRDGKVLTVKYYRASRFEPAANPIWFVMHGVSRGVDRYISIAAPVAERHNALALSIHFPESLYPSSTDYTLGVATSGKADGSTLASGRWKDPEFYPYNEVERVFDAVRAAIQGEQHGYYIFGHSAGAQFTHRLLTFLPEHRVLGAVAANAGWYTLPVNSPAAAHTVPYGIGKSPVDDTQRRHLLSTPLTVLVGERDTETPADSRLVRGTPEAMAQGKNRLERGQHYYTTSQQVAQQMATAFNWNLAVVPRAGHSGKQMIGSAAHFLFDRGTAQCTLATAGNASQVRFTEILADPPDDMTGDANNDAVRDSADDEFLELVNLGDAPICLAGWSIGDAKKPERHVFPLGTRLESQQIMIVFGGGVPTGDFNNALVQWAAFDGQLNLTNRGDVITLRDADDNMVDQVSWGDCANRSCAANHYPGPLNIARSIVRNPVIEPAWNPYAYASNSSARFAPGYNDFTAQHMSVTTKPHDR